MSCVRTNVGRECPIYQRDEFHGAWDRDKMTTAGTWEGKLAVLCQAKLACAVWAVTVLVAGCTGSTPSMSEGSGQNRTGAAIVVVSTRPEDAFRAQRFDEAAQLFLQQARAGGKDEHKAWFNAGAAYWNAGQKPQALDAYEQAVAVNPLYSKGHLRLTNKYASLGRTDLSAKHKKHAKAMQQITKVMLPYWDKANQLRGRGADFDYAAATIHEASAKYYDEQGLTEFAAAERTLADQSRAAGQVAKTQAGPAERQARSEAEERAFRTEVFGSLKDLPATVTNVNPASPFATASGGRSEAKMAVAGMGALEQSFGAYADTMQMFEGKLQAQREEIRQQGQQAQAALADPKQAQLQRDAQQRTLELQKKLEAMEQQAAAYLAAEGLLDEVEASGDRDSLDL